MTSPRPALCPVWALGACPHPTRKRVYLSQGERWGGGSLRTTPTPGGIPAFAGKTEGAGFLPSQECPGALSGRVRERKFGRRRSVRCTCQPRNAVDGRTRPTPPTRPVWPARPLWIPAGGALKRGNDGGRGRGSAARHWRGAGHPQGMPLHQAGFLPLQERRTPIITGTQKGRGCALSASLRRMVRQAHHERVRWGRAPLLPVQVALVDDAAGFELGALELAGGFEVDV